MLIVVLIIIVALLTGANYTRYPPTGQSDDTGKAMVGCLLMLFWVGVSLAVGAMVWGIIFSIIF